MLDALIARAVHGRPLSCGGLQRRLGQGSCIVDVGIVFGSMVFQVCSSQKLKPQPNAEVPRIKKQKPNQRIDNLVQLGLGRVGLGQFPEEPAKHPLRMLGFFNSC